MALLISSAALILLAHFLSSPGGPTVETASAAITVKWSADLRASIGSRPLGLVFGRKREREGKPRTSLWFLDDSTIVATFVTQEEAKHSLSSRDSDDPNQPLRLRAIFLDVGTGKIKSTQAWPSESRMAGILVAHDRKFVAQTGTTLTLYSSDGKEMNKLSLPPPPQNLNGWNAHVSPTGKRVLFEDSDWKTTTPKSWIWVDSDDLQIMRSWKEEQSGRVGISDSTIAMTACMFPEFHCELNLRVKGPATQWKTIARIEKSYWGWAPQFVDSDTLFLPGTPWELLKTDGKVVLTVSDPRDGGVPITSARGERFVVPFFKLVGRVEALDVGGYGELKTISIYDAPFHERSYKLEVRGPKIKSFSDKSLAQLALSPDGSSLAILYDESVYFFQLPPPLPGKRSAPAETIPAPQGLR